MLVRVLLTLRLLHSALQPSSPTLQYERFMLVRVLLTLRLLPSALQLLSPTSQLERSMLARALFVARLLPSMMKPSSKTRTLPDKFMLVRGWLIMRPSASAVTPSVPMPSQSTNRQLDQRRHSAGNTGGAQSRLIRAVAHGHGACG